jgi:hypothetical protein
MIIIPPSTAATAARISHSIIIHTAPHQTQPTPMTIHIIHIHHVLLFVSKIIRTILPFVIMSRKSTWVVIFSLGRSHVAADIVAIITIGIIIVVAPSS